jgi:hypothetical protein
MNTISKTVLYFQMPALLLTAALAGPAKPQTEEVFRGSLHGDETYQFQDTTLLSHGDGTGIATHLGRFTATWETVSYPFEPVNHGDTTYHFIAANGDSLFVETSGQAEGTLPVFHVVETGDITGGTGRFTGATGSFTIERVTVVTDDDSGTVVGTFSGTIVLDNRNCRK